MMNAKISQKHDNMLCVRKNYIVKYVYNDSNECINDMLSSALLASSTRKCDGGIAPRFLLLVAGALLIRARKSLHPALIVPHMI